MSESVSPIVWRECACGDEVWGIGNYVAVPIVGWWRVEAEFAYVIWTGIVSGCEDSCHGERAISRCCSGRFRSAGVYANFFAQVGQTWGDRMKHMICIHCNAGQLNWVTVLRRRSAHTGGASGRPACNTSADTTTFKLLSNANVECSWKQL